MNPIDEDNSGVLDFSEYVEALGKFCVLSKEEILKCAWSSLNSMCLVLLVFVPKR